MLWNLSLDGAITFGFPNLNQRGFVIAAERTVDTFIYILITAGAVALEVKEKMYNEIGYSFWKSQRCIDEEEMY